MKSNGSFKKERLKQQATAVELLRRAQEEIGSALRRIRNDREAQRECSEAIRFLASAQFRVMSVELLTEYLDSATARLMVEEARNWRNILEDQAEHKKEGHSTVCDFLSPEFVECVLNLAREAEFLTHHVSEKKS